jgi:DnaJ-class molecular chaperone
MIERKDPYEVLDVAPDADAKEIQKRYRKLAREHHPDLNPDDPEAEARFKDISEAYRILGDAELRSSYDEFGAISLEPGFDAEEARQAQAGFGSPFGARGGAGHARSEQAFGGGLEDLFGQFFAGGREQQELRMAGPDLEATLELDFLEAVFGGEKALTLAPSRAGGPLAPETIKVRIPRGVDTGGRLRIPGKGAPGFGNGPAGDLWVTLSVRPHPFFVRDGTNLSLELPISVREAIRGANVEVPTLEGSVVMSIPPGTHSGTRLRLKRKGVAPARGGEPGDLFVRIQIRVPEALDEDADAALDKLAAFEDPDIRSALFA